MADCNWAPMLAELLRASHTAQAEAIPALIDRFAKDYLGVYSATLYLADYQQSCLLPATGADDFDGFAVEGTMGGRAFITTEIVVVTGEHEDCVWVPVVDGTERVGVLAFTVAHETDVSYEACTALAWLTAELVVTKGQYSDVFFVARRRRELTLAAEMQWELLPPLTYITPLVSVAGALEPAYEAGGDAFDYALNGSTLHIAMVDAMGHGTRASLMATAVLGTYRHARRSGKSLVETFTEMDNTMSSMFGDAAFATTQLATLDCGSGVLHWLNGGHPRPLLVRRNRVVGQLACDPGLPAGLGCDVVQTSEQHLEPGDAVMFFTDGITEARVAGEQFGVDRLQDFLERELSSGLQPAELMRRLARAVLGHHNGKLQDDATLLMVKWTGSSGRLDGED